MVRLALRSLTPCTPGRKWRAPAAAAAAAAWLHFGGAVAQLESASFAMRRSGVRPPSAPPIATRDTVVPARTAAYEAVIDHARDACASAAAGFPSQWLRN